MIRKEAIILAGGLGTRLRDRIGEHPKSMASVNGKPFLVYIFEQLLNYSYNKAVLATGYMHEEIHSFFGNRYKGLELLYSVENEPLGTGGAILKAASSAESGSLLVLNGDTFFDIPLDDFERSFSDVCPVLSVALKPMRNFERYGSVKISSNRIVSFEEKKFCREGYINGGVYMMKKEWLIINAPGEKFSFEKDIMEKLVTSDLIMAFIKDSYFIDIGIPEDYERAQVELR